MPTQKANPDVVIREEDDGMHLAFNVASGSGLILNPTSHFIWELAVKGLSAAEIAELVRREFDFQQPAPSPEELSEIVTAHLVLLERTRLLLTSEQAPEAQKPSTHEV